MWAKFGDSEYRSLQRRRGRSRLEAWILRGLVVVEAEGVGIDAGQCARAAVLAGAARTRRADAQAASRYGWGRSREGRSGVLRRRRRF